MSVVGNVPGLAPVEYDPFAQAVLSHVVPVTEPQREVWLADKLGTDASLAYNESVSLRLHGRLDGQALQDALRELVARHDSLRATFSPTGDELCIAEEATIHLDRLDLSRLGVEEREAQVRARQLAAVETPFDLERGPLLRAELLVLSAQEHMLLLNAHHIVCDGWSFGVLVRELAALYAHGIGDTGALLEPPVSFADYARSRAGIQESGEAVEDERYWLSLFNDMPSDLELPLDRPRPRFRSFRSGREDSVLDAGLVADLRRLGARHGASLFATLFTGFATLTRRLSGQSDVVVGIAASGQAADGYDSLVGHCVNILPIRTNAAGNEGFGQVLAQTGAALLDAFEHQGYTFGTLLQKLAIARDPGRLPLVSVLFNLDQSVEDGAVRFPGIEFDLRANPRSYENFELFVNAVPRRDGSVRLECQYNSDLFDGATVRRWLGLLDTLMRSAVADATRPWQQLDWLSDGEQRALNALQPSPSVYDANWLVHQRFEARARALPHSVAVVFDGVEVTYGVLDRRANAIAQALRARGVARGERVGVCVERGPDLIAATLGVLKAGGAFVPLDPDYPADRLDYMVGDAGLAALLTQDGLADSVAIEPSRRLRLGAGIDLDSGAGALAPDVDRDATADAPAYVIYTSGSTGRPKGVVVPHRALVNHLTSMSVRPGLTSFDRLVAVTTTSFDISVLELFLPLVTGARVVLAGREDVRDGLALRRLVESSGATAMQATPSGWRVLLAAGWIGGRRFKALCGGEGLPRELADALCDRVGELWNMYGPTETTIWSTCARITPETVGTPIGTPIANTRVYVLDTDGRQCPIGMAGEIWIAGDGVTLGYLGRDELTTERFVEDPWGAPGARMYRTGDRGRWRNDGMLEHLGRLDFQVKVRGYRIEPGEIEANLASHVDVAQCAVMAREDRPGDVRLVAYVVPSAAASPGEAALQAHLRATLPDYMVPQHLVLLDALPLTLNGKVDRKALPAPDTGAARAPDRIAPRTDVERTIAAHMEAVLALPDISIDDDFFALGGHSLLAAQLTSRLNRELGLALSLRTLFDAPTVARLAAAIDALPRDGTQLQPRILRRGDQRRAPLSLMQERIYLIEKFNPATLSYKTPSAHRLHGPLDVAVLDHALRDLAQRQTVLRTAIVEENGEAVQVVEDDIETGLHDVADFSHLDAVEREAEVRRRMQALISVPFGALDRAPLFRAKLFRLAEEEHVLFFIPHHIIWDGWSFDLLYAQLSELYAAHLARRDPALPELPVSYGDYAVWHREWLKGPEYARQLAFWRELLVGAGHGLDRVRPLPTDRPRTPGMSGQGRMVPLTVPEGLTAELHATSRAMGSTLFVTLLAAYCTLMTGATGQNHHIVGTPVRGRNSADVEDLIGYFTNLLPLYIRIDPDRAFAEAVRDVKTVVLDSFANPDVRLEHLVRELKLRGREGGAAVLYQSLFSFQDIRQRATRWGPLRHERIEVSQPGATEDIGIWFVEGEHGLAGELIYNAEIFDESTAVLLHDRYVALLQAIVADPSRTVAALSSFDDGCPARIGRAPGPGTGDTDATASSIAPVQAPAAPVAADTRVQYLMDLWSELLHTPVAPRDNFFDLGGNSMLGVQMAERVLRDTGVRLNLIRLGTDALEQVALELPTQGTQSPEPTARGLGGSLRRLFSRGSQERH